MNFGLDFNKEFNYFRECQYLLMKFCQLTEGMTSRDSVLENDGDFYKIAKVSSQINLKQGLYTEKVDVQDPIKDAEETEKLFVVVIDISDKTNDHVAWNDVQFPFCMGFNSEQDFVNFVCHNCGKNNIKTFESANEIQLALHRVTLKTGICPLIKIYFVPIVPGAVQPLTE